MGFARGSGEGAITPTLLIFDQTCKTPALSIQLSFSVERARTHALADPALDSRHSTVNGAGPVTRPSQASVQSAESGPPVPKDPRAFERHCAVGNTSGNLPAADTEGIDYYRFCTSSLRRLRRQICPDFSVFTAFWPGNYI